MRFLLEDFVRESNRIEGIHRAPLQTEIDATVLFLNLEQLTIHDFVDLVRVYQPNAKPRFVKGLDVRVGDHYPPPGGYHVQVSLQDIVDDANDIMLSAYDLHVEYEMLHPFTDGNGRSGRALWLWCMGGIERAPLGFLHHFYYQALQGTR